MGLTEAVPLPRINRGVSMCSGMRRRLVSRARKTAACGWRGMGAIADRTGSLYVLFRSATETIHRDIYLLTSADGGDHFQGANVAPWNVGACVMSTESFSESPAGVLAAWEQTGQVYYGVVNPQTRRITSSIAAPGEGAQRK